MEGELRIRVRELAEGDRRKDEFLAMLAHELRNPLAPIGNALQVIERSADRAVREHAHAVMGRQLNQMVRLVDDLLDVSRISRGKIELRRERILLADLITNAVETSRHLIDDMGHTLVLALPDEPLAVDVDTTRMVQVLLNVLNNAAKYSERSGRIEVTAGREGDEAVVSVRDTGVGIAADQLPLIFDMFAQVERSLEKAMGGLGIGLTLVKRLVEMHGGTVEARSDGPGKGSEFIVRLPLDHRGPSAERTVVAPGIAKKLFRILVVDDNRDGADSLAMVLSIMGNDVRTAYDGEEGVEVACDFRPEVIVFDIGLPKLNGYDACRRVRGEPWGRGVVIIALTGWGQEEDRRRTLEAGFDYHMVKPLNHQELGNVLEQLADPASHGLR